MYRIQYATIQYSKKYANTTLSNAKKETVKMNPRCKIKNIEVVSRYLSSTAKTSSATTTTTTALWTPTKEHIEQTKVYKFIHKMNTKHTRNKTKPIETFDDLWEWSIKNPAIFWKEVALFTNILSTPIHSDGIDNTTGSNHNNDASRMELRGDNMWEQHFFPNVCLNFADNLLQRERRNSNETAIIFWGEDKIRTEISHDELYRKVTTLANILQKDMGVKSGDVVAGFVPNTPHALIAMLATTALGAIWSSGSPDFGLDGALDRFGQINPKVLFACDGYYYNGKKIDVSEKVVDIERNLTSLEHTIVFDYIHEDAVDGEAPCWPSHFKAWDDIVEATPTTDSSTTFEFKKFPFNHPLYIMFSSGTTGKPKCIVHGSGGTLLQHVKEHQLHFNIQANDRMFYFTTCGWMMWNWLVTGLASDAVLVLYDGSPFAQKGTILLDMIQKEHINFFGVSAKYIDALSKLKLLQRQPIHKTYNVSSLKTIGSTGSPLSHESFEFVYENIKKDVQLSSLSGGTDILSCFAAGNPIGSVYKGQLQSRGLGMNVDVFDTNGLSIKNQKGELVCKDPFPSMPLYFWNDKDNKRYKHSYFDTFGNAIWCQGDYVELTSQNGMIFHGRSDAVLNPGGVRIGTSEIYRQVEKVEQVIECFAIGQKMNRKDDDERIVLFVKLQKGIDLDDPLETTIRNVIVKNTTRRHVPEVIIQVPDIPKTRNGKIVEIAVRNIIHGDEVKNVEALDNPEVLDFYRDFVIPKLAH